VMFIGLNPSIADGETDDPTIRRCKAFVRSWGYGGFTWQIYFRISRQIRGSY
jgi:hypothetical protein